MALAVQQVVRTTVASLEQCVDDMTSRILGEGQVIILQFAKHIQALWKRSSLAQINFAATKSVVLSSRVGLKKQLQRILKCLGITLEAGTEARDLGVDRGAR